MVTVNLDLFGYLPLFQVFSLVVISSARDTLYFCAVLWCLQFPEVCAVCHWFQKVAYGTHRVVVAIFQPSRQVQGPHLAFFALYCNRSKLYSPDYLVIMEAWGQTILRASLCQVTNHCVQQPRPQRIPWVIKMCNSSQRN